MKIKLMRAMAYIRYKVRWLTYFDLLGFKALVRRRKLDEIIDIYENCIQILEMKASPKRKYGIDYAWGSDTFLIFTKSDSLEQYRKLEKVSCLFFDRMIIEGIPIRGAITVGLFYTHLKRNTFLGEALVDAHEYCEDQDWLGLILTPQAESYLEESDYIANNNKFKKNQIPFKHNMDIRNLYAYIIGSWWEDTNRLLAQISNMQRSQRNQEVRQKYENTIRFLRR